MIDALTSNKRYITAQNAELYALSRFESLYVRSMRFDRPVWSLYERAVNPHEN